ncbi:MAG: RDD family protein [Candidatus Eremiobacteraeota bacterium]|nr:RDD family protein [Candidatus Eremiobacteraeota bacterium]
MDRTVAIATPESITFSYELAGLGSRFIAVVLDLLVQLMLAALTMWGLIALGSHAPSLPKDLNAADKTAASIAQAIVIFLLFAIFFGYFIIFEAAWNGQTPGKRLTGIRVVRDGGYPVDLTSSLVRNLVRALEFGFGFYVCSAVSSLLSSENKRLGDYAAGTIVVRDAAAPAPHLKVFGAAPSLQLSAEERDLVGRYMARRAELRPERRALLAHQIAEPLRSKVSADFGALDDERFIERIDGLL